MDQAGQWYHRLLGHFGTSGQSQHSGRNLEVGDQGRAGMAAMAVRILVLRGDLASGYMQVISKVNESADERRRTVHAGILVREDRNL